jgi:hypothetical protein
MEVIRVEIELSRDLLAIPPKVPPLLKVVRLAYMTESG